MTAPVQVVISERAHRALMRHLFPGDHDEHGAVLSFGVASSARGTRLLVREVELARDGVEFVPGTRGYRALTGAFVTEHIRRCRDGGWGYMAVHNHGGRDSVAFSSDDLASHQRGYPALLQISKQPVGALVFAANAVAGDIWWPDGTRTPVDELVVVGGRIERYHPSRAHRSRAGVQSEMYDRQARLFGSSGQAVLRRLKVGVIGVGGAGSLIVEYLARLGVGHMVVADPDRVELSNVSRITGSTRWDARHPLTSAPMPLWLRRAAAKWSTPKVRVARRIARRANPTGRVEPIFGDFTRDEIARRFSDCDYLFLAADSFQARLVFNALVHQYLIPGVQVGVKIPVDRDTGEVGSPFAVARPVYPISGCLWCNGLIPPGRLQEEAQTPRERAAGRYVDHSEVVAPSVISLNAIATSHAVNQMLFAVMGLHKDETPLDYLRFLPREQAVLWEEPRQEADCSECSLAPASRFAGGDGSDLPTH